jgi:hypothetical protein
MAVYASLMCRKMTTGMDEGIEKDELDEQAAMYEDWAMELLEEAEEDAATLLLGLPLAYIPGDPEDFLKLWSDSVLEAAIGDDSEVRCLRFISHRLCKQIVYNIFRGFVYQLQHWKTLLDSLPAEDLKVLYGEEERRELRFVGTSNKLPGLMGGFVAGSPRTEGHGEPRASLSRSQTAALDSTYIDHDDDGFELFRPKKAMRLRSWARWEAFTR